MLLRFEVVQNSPQTLLTGRIDQEKKHNDDKKKEKLQQTDAKSAKEIPAGATAPEGKILLFTTPLGTSRPKPGRAPSFLSAGAR